jgi:type II secretory pathway predicted ATPase ExeA
MDRVPTVEMFPSRSHTQALAQVSTALSEGAAGVLVTGAPGIGKTTLCRALAAGTGERTFAASIVNPSHDVAAVLSQLLRDFGLVPVDSPAVLDAAPKRLIEAAIRFLASLRPLDAHVLVIVDDAERADADVLTMLDDISSQADPHRRLLRLVLVGQPWLEARLAEPRLQALGSRLTTSVRLRALGRDELLAYVMHQVSVDAPGESPPRLTSDALDEVYRESDGVPARVNLAIVPLRQIATETSVVAVDGEWRDDSGTAVAGGGGFRFTWSMAAVLALWAGLVAAAGWWWILRPARPGEPLRAEEPAVKAPRTTPGGAVVVAGTPPAERAVATGGDVVPAPTTTSATSTPTPANATPLGTATDVVPTAADPGLTGPPMFSATGATSPYRIMVASFRTSGRAEYIAAQVRGLKIPARVTMDSSGTWYQVIAGPFLNIEAGRDAQRRLESAGFVDTQLTVALPSDGLPDSTPPGR